MWIALGFIHESGSRILEDVAMGYFMDLLKKGLLMTGKKIAHGQINRFQIHKTLQAFRLKKAVEEHFSPHVYTYAHIQAPASSRTITNTQHEMSLNPSELGDILQKGGSILSEKYKSLRVLDMNYVHLSVFPSDVTQLVNLRYLAIQAEDGSPQASISNLVNLQTLIISSRKNIVVPKTIWNMINLRYLYIKSRESIIEDDGCPSALSSLQTLSQVSFRSCQNLSSRTPNLRKLGFCGPLISHKCDLSSLQKVKLLKMVFYPMFPEKLKKLTLSNAGMNWDDMWTFAWLPNLEVLKLKLNACVGETWETGDAEFKRLKVLKLHYLDIRKWVCSRDNFPTLKHLVIRRCLNLDSIPQALQLKSINVKLCSKSVL